MDKKGREVNDLPENEGPSRTEYVIQILGDVIRLLRDRDCTLLLLVACTIVQ